MLVLFVNNRPCYDPNKSTTYDFEVINKLEIPVNGSIVIKKNEVIVAKNKTDLNKHFLPFTCLHMSSDAHTPIPLYTEILFP